MKRRAFGSTGLEVPVIGQGTWQLRRPDHAETSLRLGLELGMTHIDTAELYRGSEEVVSRAIAGRRDEVFLVSKVLPRNATYTGTLQACDASLRRLHTDHLDVYLLHWWEDFVNLEEWARAMGELVDQKKIRHIGVSNFDVPELEKAQSVLGKRRVVCDQVYYDLEHRNIENVLIPYCAKNGIAVVAYSPFGSGRFNWKTGAAQTLDAVSKRTGLTPPQVVLQFLARPETVFVIPKAETEAHVQSNAACLDVSLSQADIAAIDQAFPVSRATELPVL